MVDGVSGTDLMTVILSKEREATAAVDDGWAPAPEPNSAALVTYALAQRAASPLEGLRTVLSAVRGPRRVARHTVDVARGFANLRTLLSRNPSSTLNGPIGPHRRWDWARARLVDIKQIRALTAARSTTSCSPRSPVALRSTPCRPRRNRAAATDGLDHHHVRQPRLRDQPNPHLTSIGTSQGIPTGALASSSTNGGVRSPDRV